MDAPLTVACVLRTGGDFTAEYVIRLEAAFAQHCKVPHKFVCLSNARVPRITTIPLRHNWPGWWSKLELFYLKGPVVYADLDTMIVSDITDICAYPHEFSILMGVGEKPTSIGGGEHDFGSAFMAWNADMSNIPAAFSEDQISKYRTRERWGDQAFIQDMHKVPATKLQDLFPGRFVLYKQHVRRPDKSPGPPPAGASVVCFSGKPRPHEINWTLPAS